MRPAESPTEEFYLQYSQFQINSEWERVRGLICQKEGGKTEDGTSTEYAHCPNSFIEIYAPAFTAFILIYCKY
jgi:superfamily I DNA and RNA helicase